MLCPSWVGLVLMWCVVERSAVAVPATYPSGKPTTAVAPSRRRSDDDNDDDSDTSDDDARKRHSKRSAKHTSRRSSSRKDSESTHHSTKDSGKKKASRKSHRDEASAFTSKSSRAAAAAARKRDPSPSSDDDQWNSDLDSTPGTATVFEARDEIIQELLQGNDYADDAAARKERRKEKVTPPLGRQLGEWRRVRGALISQPFAWHSRDFRSFHFRIYVCTHTSRHTRI